MKITKTSNMSEAEILKCLAASKIGLSILLEGEAYCENPSSSWVRVETKDKVKNMCFCNEGYGKPIKNYCPYCGSGLSRNFFKIPTLQYIEETSKKVDDYIAAHKEPDDDSSRFYAIVLKVDKEVLYDRFYVEQHPDYEFGIRIKKVTITAVAKKDGIYLDGKMSKYVDIIPGVSSAAYDIKRGVACEGDMFKIFNLSSHTKKYNVLIDFDGASNMLDFLFKHPDFAKRTAFMEVFSSFETKMSHNSFFMLYLYTYASYPVIEFLAKMGYSRLINQALAKIANSYNKENMQDNAEKLTKVFNPYATSGKFSLSIPKYIGDFLQQTDAGYKSFETWSDIYAYEPLSKENFMDYVTSDEYFAIRDDMHKIPNIQKYGYKIAKLTRYIIKQSELLKHSPSRVIGTMTDYLQMNELMGTTPDEYPANIEDVHNKTMAAYTASKNKLNDEAIAKYKKAAEKLIPESSDFTIVIPACTYDFIEEGNRQHNCVASYAQRVAKGTCFVFFVRRKEDPSASYITAEYKNGSAYQVLERNNRPVGNPNAYEYAKEFCRKLSKDITFRTI